MKRNDLINAVGQRIDAMRLDIAKADDTPSAWARVGELERFCNDLCNVPCKHNRERGDTICYTMTEARRKWRSLG